jgi:hypothetical protein
MTPIFYFSILGFLTAGISILPAVRKKRWGLAIWLPIVVLDIRVLLEIFGAPPKSGGSGPDGGAVDMEVGFFFLGALPFIICSVVSLIVAAVAFPRRLAWNKSGGLIAIIASAIVWFTITGCLTPKITFRVIDEKGIPMPAVTVKFSTSSFGSGKSLGTKITDHNGKVKMRLPRGNWTVDANGDDGRTAGIGLNNRNYDRDPKNVTLSFWWRQPGWSKLAPSCFTNGHFGNQRNFEIMFRKRDELVSPDFAKELHDHLLEILSGKRQFNGHEINNLESYMELHLLVQIAEKYPSVRQEMADSLPDRSVLVYHCWQTIVAIENNKPGDWWISYTEICQWLGFSDDPKLTQQIAPQIRVKFENMAGDLLALAEPLWGTNKPPVVYEQLNELAKSAAPQFLHAMESANGDWVENYWRALESSQPKFEQVRPFFNSTNSFVAAAAINAVRGKLLPQDASMALERLRAISDPSNKSWLQYQVGNLMPIVAARANPAGSRNLEFDRAKQIQ